MAQAGPRQARSRELGLDDYWAPTNLRFAGSALSGQAFVVSCIITRIGCGFLLFIDSAEAQGFLFSPVLLPGFLIVYCVSLSLLPRRPIRIRFSPCSLSHPLSLGWVAAEHLSKRSPYAPGATVLTYLPWYGNFYNLCWLLARCQYLRYDRRPRLYHTSTRARANFSPSSSKPGWQKIEIVWFGALA